MRVSPVGLLAAALATAVLVVPALAAAQTTVAVVDMQRAIMQTEDGLRAQHTVKKFFDRRQQDLDHRQQELVKERKELDQQRRVLSKASWQRRLEHYQRRMLETQTRFIEYTKELQKRQSELTKPIIRKMFSIIARIARGRGIDVVVDKAAVHYARPDLDLTDLVVQMYNSGEVGDDDADPGGDKPK